MRVEYRLSSLEEPIKNAALRQDEKDYITPRKGKIHSFMVELGRTKLILIQDRAEENSRIKGHDSKHVI